MADIHIKVIEEISSRCITKATGEKTYALIKKVIEDDNKLILDFDGIAAFASPFFNNSIGIAIGNYSSEQIETHLVFENLNETGESILDTVIENSVSHYGRSIEYRNKVFSIIASHTG